MAQAIGLVSADPAASYLAGGTTHLDLVLKDRVVSTAALATGRRIRSLPITIDKLL